ncbi:MAG: YfcE family phosphodiesterase [Pirellulaceae bacterium]|jgi:hypothetical protein|nr:YfcE family phosphodiesterase [Pirellulaceae bacterium]MDP6719826.1 YfcE family phosphodiesterase [Pirellulaceae bacterium]MDP7015150.1 YfcE family phosphodiesterase [Pirellulaceae bacterium]
MIIAVVSDTHGHVHYTRQAVRMLEEFEPDAVLHCGDIGSPEIPPLFAAWPTHYVFGNVDRNERSLRMAIEQSGGVCHRRFGELLLAERPIALLHGDDNAKFRHAQQCGEFDLVCYGHTHVAKTHHVAATLVLNPGALYRATPHSIALVDLLDLTATSITVA